jgi:phage FluMu protein Com
VLLAACNAAGSTSCSQERIRRLQTIRLHLNWQSPEVQHIQSSPCYSEIVMQNVFKLPRFARDYFRDNARCRCCTKLFDADVTFVGAGRDEDSSICFSYEAKCSQCKRVNTFIDKTRKFSETNWWEELAVWHEHALEQMGPFDRHPTHQKAVRLVLGPPPLQPLFVYSGFRGDVGPVYLSFSGGVCRLERGVKIRRFEIGDYANHMKPHGWNRLRRTPEGAQFVYEGVMWTRLTRNEMSEIVRDRVFEVLPGKGSSNQTAPPCVNKHGSPHASKSSKGHRRPPRNSVAMDSRRRRPEGLH